MSIRHTLLRHNSPFRVTLTLMMLDIAREVAPLKGVHKRALHRQRPFQGPAKGLISLTPYIYTHILFIHLSLSLSFAVSAHEIAHEVTLQLLFIMFLLTLNTQAHTFNNFS